VQRWEEQTGPTERLPARHRFVAMTNATQILGAENWVPDTRKLCSARHRSIDIAAQQEGKLGSVDGGVRLITGFIDLMCFRTTREECNLLLHGPILQGE